MLLLTQLLMEHYMTVFYLDILSGLGESPIYIKADVSHYTQIAHCPSSIEHHSRLDNVNTPTQLAPFDSYLTQICNIY